MASPVTMCRTKTGELDDRRCRARSKSLSKSLRPWPEKFHGVNRRGNAQRASASSISATQRREQEPCFMTRSNIIHSRAEDLARDAQFVEVETPLMQAERRRRHRKTVYHAS